MTKLPYKGIELLGKYKATNPSRDSVFKWLGVKSQKEFDDLLVEATATMVREEIEALEGEI